MKEKFLHFIWRFQLFQTLQLSTTDGHTVTILEKGLWNKIDSGPDFSMAKIKIGETIWVGNVEIHVRSSDWDLHQHSSDKSYENVILHVVYENNRSIEFLKERNIQTLELKNFISPEIMKNYDNLVDSDQNFIPCEQSIHLIQKDSIGFWLERMVIERLERKTSEIEKEFKDTSKNWEELLFKKLAYAFGLKTNAEAFTLWANSFDFKVLVKIQNQPQYINALFFGQAGFLEINSNDPYIINLQKDYAFLKLKYNLSPLDKSIFKFFRLRPISFPTVRIMQLATLYSHYHNLFMFLLGTKKLDAIWKIFEELKYPEFWLNHFTLDKESERVSSKEISRELVDRIILNVLIPIKYLYEKERGVEDYDLLINWLQEIPPENNIIIQEFSKLGLKAKNAFDSQAYLELKKHFCNEKKCLNCALGLQILKHV